MISSTNINIINENEIQTVLANHRKSPPSPSHIREILHKACSLKGLNLNETAALLQADDPILQQEIFQAAKQVKNEIYGKRLVIFAPLYISNLCSNNCLYCAFRSENKGLKRRYLNQDEIIKETEELISEGHKRIVLLTGEAYPNNDFHYITNALETIYKVKCHNGSIRRINVEIAPLTDAEFKELKACNIGTYIVFQETYHRETYHKVHLSGKKTDYDWRLTAMDRAMQAGIDDVGIGVLFGLYDWRFEVLALLQHAEYLQKQFGVGPHTISVPRLEAASGSELASHPLAPVKDDDFCKIVAILRLAVPYTGIIMSTRETPELRRATFALGVSQISAGSRTNPGGYSKKKDEDVTNSTQNADIINNNTTAGQFSLGDHRSLDEVIKDVATLGYSPSFCTACYRLGRTGEDFMSLAKPGKIKNMCSINSLLTFYEYLLDYAKPETRRIGAGLIQKELASLPEEQKEMVRKMLNAMHNDGTRDLYV